MLPCKQSELFNRQSFTYEGREIVYYKIRQRQNEIVFVPSEWYHQVKNIDSTIQAIQYYQEIDFNDTPFIILSNPKRNSSNRRILAGFCRSSLGKPMSSIDDIGFQRIIKMKKGENNLTRTQLEIEFNKFLKKV